MSDPRRLIDAYLDGAMDADEARALDEWLCADGDHLRAFVRAAILHHDLRQELRGAADRAAVEPVPRQWRPRSAQLRLVAALAAAAVIIMSIGLRLSTRDQFPVIAQWRAAECHRDGEMRVMGTGDALEVGDEVAIASGGAVVMRYADGSVLELDADSAATVGGGNDGERLALRRGRMTAVIAPQPAGRDFAVTTPQARVCVLGTRFAVAIEANRTRVAVEHGLVRVERRSDAAEIEIAAGDETMVPADTSSLMTKQRSPVGPERLQTIIDDMTLPPDGRPHGVPEVYSWASGAATPMSSIGDASGMRAAAAWAQAYHAHDAQAPVNTRIELRRLRLAVLSRSSGTWRVVQDGGDIDGAAFVEDFADNRHHPVRMRREADGGFSAALEPGHNLHVWPTAQRVAIDDADVAGVYVTVEARLIVDDPALSDARDRAGILLHAGGEYRRSVDSDISDATTLRTIAAGRFKRVTSEWRPFSMISVSADQARRTPPPGD